MLEYKLSIVNMRRDGDSEPDYELTPYVPPPPLRSLLADAMQTKSFRKRLVESNAFLRSLQK